MAQFQPGQSGNPGGRPKVEGRVKELARAHTEDAMRVLIDALADPDRRIAMKAAELILDRGHGKPLTTSEVTVKREARELDDATLHDIAAGRGEGVAAQEGGAVGADSVH